MSASSMGVFTLLFLVPGLCSSCQVLPFYSNAKPIGLWPMPVGSERIKGNKSRSQNRATPTLQRLTKEVARSIYKQSVSAADELEKQHKGRLTENRGRITDRQFQKIVTEFVIVMVHLADRDSFEILGNSKRSVFMDLVASEINALGTNSPMTSSHQVPAFKTNVGNIKVVGLDLDLLNKRQQEYAQYSKVLPALKEPLKGTLLWEFSKHIGEILTKESRLMASVLASEAYIGLLPLLAKLRETPL